MVRADRVYTRLSIEDLILSPEQMEKFENAITVLLDEDNQTIEDLNFYTVGYEDEEGNECEEDGEYLY